jgi:hypothetical protein
MPKQIKIKITYRNGTREEHCIDNYKIKDGCLCTYVRFGTESGTKHIPLDLIKEFITY